MYYPCASSRTIGFIWPMRASIPDLGLLRWAMMATTIIVIVAAPFADGNAHVNDWRLYPSVIAPSIMMMLVFAIPLDICMARVFMSDCDQSERRRLQRAIVFESIMLAILCSAWTPFMLKVLGYWPQT